MRVLFGIFARLFQGFRLIRKVDNFARNSLGKYTLIDVKRVPKIIAYNLKSSNLQTTYNKAKKL
jgi:hypothetical protein